MNNTKITKRDVKFFFLGILFLLLLEIILNWSSIKKGFTHGYKDASTKDIIK